MSTTFGINTSSFHDFELDEDGELPYWLNRDIFKEVAYRGGNIVWTNSLASMLPDETKVYPLDNSAHGVYTIGDIKKLMEQNYE